MGKPGVGGGEEKRMIFLYVEDVDAPPKTNMEPENRRFEKEIHLPNLHFWVPC